MQQSRSLTYVSPLTRHCLPLAADRYLIYQPDAILSSTNSHAPISRPTALHNTPNPKTTVQTTPKSPTHTKPLITTTPVYATNSATNARRLPLRPVLHTSATSTAQPPPETQATPAPSPSSTSAATARHIDPKAPLPAEDSDANSDSSLPIAARHQAFKDVPG